MTVERLQEVLGIEDLPAVYTDLLPRFEQEWKDICTQPLFEREAVEALIDEGFIDGACMPDVNACLEKIEAEEELRFALQYLYYVLCVYRRPWENEFYRDPAPSALGEYRYTFAYIILLRCLQKSVSDVRRRGMPETAVAQLKGAADCGRGEPWGLRGMFHWHMSCALGTMFFVGLFRYEIERMPEGYRMFRRKADGKLLLLWAGERRFDKYGQFTHLDEHTAFRTKEPVGTTDGNLIRPDGVVTDRYVVLDEREWEEVYVQGDMSLSYHIPSKASYTIEAAKESFMQALDFYHRYFPEICFKGIECYSWLYSPQLKELLPKESGINRFNDKLYISAVPSGADGFYTFVFQTNEADFDPKTAPTDTLLRRRFVEFVQKGGRAHNGFMFLPVQTVPRLGEDKAELYAWDLF